MSGDGRDDPLFTEEFGDWTLLFSRAEGIGADASMTVQIERKGKARARLSIPVRRADGPPVIAALRDKARQWIVDYESRPHGAGSDFMPL